MSARAAAKYRTKSALFVPKPGFDVLPGLQLINEPLIIVHSSNPNCLNAVLRAVFSLELIK